MPEVLDEWVWWDGEFHVVRGADFTLVVETDPASDVSGDTAQLNGTVVDLGDDVAVPVDVSFEYREDGETEWNIEDAGDVLSTDSFSSVVNVESETQYEFRALAESDDGLQSDQGDIRLFTALELNEIENFEDEPDGVYGATDDLSDFYSLDTGDFARTDTNAPEGNHALEVTNASANVPTIYSLPGDGLMNYAGRGETIRVLLHDESSPNDEGQQAGFFYGLEEDGGNIVGYGIDILNAGGSSDYRLRRYSDLESFSQTVVAGEGGTEIADGWIWTEIEWGMDDSHEIRLYTLASESPPERGSLIETVSTTDGTYTTGEGIGFGAVINGPTPGLLADGVRVLDD